MGNFNIKLAAVSKIFGSTKAVNAVDMALAPGECVVLVGHNGAGKSTLIKLILGLIKPNSGQIEVLGQNPSSKAAAKSRRSIGYLPETVALHPSLTGIETLNFYAELKGLSTKNNLDLLAKVGISQVAKQRVRGYSKGMRQRLALAQALLGQPQLLLFDEPTTGLDPASRLLFYDIVRELQASGASILLSSHALAEMEGLADRVIVMQKGIKIADGSMSELRQSANLPITIRASFSQLPDPIPANWQQIGNQRLEISIPTVEKLVYLKQINQLIDLTDIEMVEPGLDEMYAHFLQRDDV